MRTLVDRPRLLRQRECRLRLSFVGRTSPTYAIRIPYSPYERDYPARGGRREASPPPRSGGYGGSRRSPSPARGHDRRSPPPPLARRLESPRRRDERDVPVANGRRGESAEPPVRGEAGDKFDDQGDR